MITQGKWEAMRNNLGMGHKGEIIVITEELKNANEQPVARKIRSEDDAALIAAAPDMLKLIKDQLEWDGILPHMKQRIADVIAKAEPN